MKALTSFSDTRHKTRESRATAFYLLFSQLELKKETSFDH